MSKKKSIKRGENERHSTPIEIFYIFERTLEDWKPIKIYNIMIQNNSETKVTRRDVDNISTGNVKISPNEITKEEYIQYQYMRQKVYEYHRNKKIEKKNRREEDE